MEEKKKAKRFKINKTLVREWGEAFVTALILALIIRAFFIQAFKIPTGSMKSTLVPGDRLFVSKLHFGPLVPFTDKRIPGFSEIKRGDIIVFEFPQYSAENLFDRVFNPPKDFIKRVIARGGETVEIKFGDIYINGELITDPIIKNTYYYNRGKLGARGQKIVVPEGNLYVLGDNSASSHDSRFWGFVPHKKIIGKAQFLYWPLNRIRIIK